MAGTLTASRSRAGGAVERVELVCVSDASGNVNAQPVGLVGTIRRVSFVPGADDDQPSDLFDVVLNDEAGVDLLAGGGADLDNASTTTIYPLLGSGSDVPAVVAEQCEIQVSNLGNAKQVTVVIHLSQV